MFYLATLLLTLVSYFFTALGVPTQDGCALNLAINGLQAPLVVNFTMQFPDPRFCHNTTVYFAKGELFYVSCPGGTSNYPIHYSGEPAVCHGNTTFSTLKTKLTIDFNNFTCHQNFRPFYNEMTSNVKCVNDFHLQHIGHSVDENWVQTYSVCFDKTKLVTLYSQYTPNCWCRYPPVYDTNIEWNHVSSELFDDLDMYNIYGNLKQRIEDLGVHGYITDDVYLIPVQLAVNDDFLYPFQRDTTFDYANAAVQWNSIKNGSWRDIEEFVRIEISGGEGLHLLVGTLGVASLPNSEGINVDLFLSGDRRIPVPKWFWKLMNSLVYDDSIWIFFVYNNPYSSKSEIDQEYLTTVCTHNYADKVDWASGIGDGDALSGYVYMCYSHDLIDPTIKEVVASVFNNSGYKESDMRIPDSKLKVSQRNQVLNK